MELTGKFVTLHCEKTFINYSCFGEETEMGLTVKEIRKVFTNDGWGKIKGEWHCPSCIRKSKG